MVIPNMSGDTYWYAVTPECSVAQSWASRHGRRVCWDQADWQYALPLHDAMTLVSPVNCETVEQVRYHTWEIFGGGKFLANRTVKVIGEEKFGE